MDEFRSSLSAPHPPAGLSKLLEALWYDAKGDWHTAHDLAQEAESSDGSRVHAYLHRKEGDQGNAAYWYRRAARSMPGITLQEEWEALAADFLEQRRAE